MNKSNLILASVSAIIFTSILIIFSPNSQKLNFSSSVPSRTPSQSISPTPNPTIADWKTYTNQNISFNYPSTFIAESIMSQGSGFTQEFKDSSEKYTFSYTVMGNYNQGTGKPYVSIDDYIGMPYQVAVLTIDGQTARQTLPRAGSENENSVSFFSLNNQDIYTFNLQTGDNPMTASASDVAEGQKIFSQILSTFKFTDSTADWKTYSSTAYGISFSYPEDWRVEETSDYLRVRQINPEGVLIIGIDFKKTVLSIEELLSNFEKTDSVFKQINPNIKPEKIIINGIDGYKIEYTLATGLEKISIIVSNNLHKILIEHLLPSDNIMNQILSTFKFL